MSGCPLLSSPRGRSINLAHAHVLLLGCNTFVVNFAFFQTDITGAVWGTDSWADPIVLFGPYNWNPAEGLEKRCSWDSPTVKACNHHFEEKGLIHLVKAAGAEIYPSLGGWTLSDAFPTMAADESARANFAQNCVNLIVEYGFDGKGGFQISSSFLTLAVDRLKTSHHSSPSE